MAASYAAVWGAANPEPPLPTIMSSKAAKWVRTTTFP